MQLTLALDTWQPVAAPPTRAEYRQLLDDQVLIDLGGRPLVSRPCPHCAASTVGETCPQSQPCPTCTARPGQPCRRPSDHSLSARFAHWHSARLQAADQVDTTRQDNNDPTLPAPWPPKQRARRTTGP